LQVLAICKLNDTKSLSSKYPRGGRFSSLLARILRGASVHLAGIATALIFSSPLAAQTKAQLNALGQLNAAHPRAVASGVEATTVPLAAPAGLAYDASGNLYIAALGDNVIRMVDLNGIITTVVGTGEQGFAGDGGPALSAVLDSPAGIAFDASGNLYIADSHNHRIRVVVNGTISTIAGTGVAGFSGDGAAATSAQLNLPTAVSVDASGNILIADTNNQRIRKVSSGTITTVAGNGEQTFSGDGGPAISAGLDSPNGVAFDTLVAGKFYIGDTHNQRIRQVDASGTITTLAGNGTKSFAGDGSYGTGIGLARPRGLAVDASGRIYLADSDNNRLRLLTNGVIATIAGDGEQAFSGDSGLATNAALDTPRTTAVSGLGLVALADTNNQRVRGLSISGNVSTVAGLAPTATESLVLSGPTTIVYGSGSLTATFSYGSQTATGSATLLDGTATAGTASFSGNIATFSLATLTAGQHILSVSYAGDTNSPAIVSGVFLVTITPLPIVATANPVSILYGQSIPVLTGTLTGVLPADTANVTAVFTTTATQGSKTGLYPISVALTGSAAPNYTVSLSTGGQSGASGVTIAPVASKTVLTTSNASPVFTVPITLTATVTSTTTGTPTGTVQFLNGTTALGSSTVSAGGTATLIVSTLPLGVNAIAAVYSGDTNFTASTATAISETVLSSDFTFALATGGNGTQTVAPGVAASFPFTVSPTLATFPQAVTFTVSGLPTGASYTLSPTSIAAGTGSTSMLLTVTPPNLTGKLSSTPGGNHSLPAIALGMLLLPFGVKRFRTLSRQMSRRGLLLVWMAFGLAAAGALTGCGAGGFFNQPQQSYNIVVTATSGSISHSASVTLTVQ
jgi:sugar lactone lactonase YvrE